MKSQSSILNDLIVHEKKEVSDFSRVVDTLLNDKFKRRKTILKNEQVPKMTTMDVLAQIYDIPFLIHWVNNYAEWRTSGDKGKGRQDIVEISKFHYNEMQNQRNELMGLLRK